MIYLVFTICFASGQCSRHEVLTDAGSIMACIVTAQAEIARRYPEQRGQVITDWRCREGADA